jgi:hypothetical protein
VPPDELTEGPAIMQIEHDEEHRHELAASA